MSMYQQIKIGSLDVIKVQSTEGKDGPAVMLCHGFGASAHDLAPLSQIIKAKPNTTWYFPQGPLEFPIGPRMKGRAWFPLISEEIQRALAEGKTLSFVDVVPSGLSESREKLVRIVEEIKNHTTDITIGGFSQGAMMTTDLFLRSEENFSGLAILSGTLICRSEWKELAKGKKPFQFFQSHGTYDPVLPFENAKRLEELLRDGGLSGEFVTFPGGHEIPEGVVKRFGQYLTR